MCKTLAFQLHDSRLSQDAKDKERLTLKQAMIDVEQAFGLWKEDVDISHNCFFVVPPIYRRLSYSPMILT